MSSAVCGVMCGIPYMELRTDALSVLDKDTVRLTPRYAGNNSMTTSTVALLYVDPFELH